MSNVHSEKYRSKHSGDNNYFRGFLYCGLCDREIIKYSYNPYENLEGNCFQCAGRREYKCNCEIISDIKLEKALIEYFSCIDTNAEKNEQATISNAKAAIIGTLNDKIYNLDKKDKWVTDMWLEEKLTFDEHTSVIVKLKNKRKKLSIAIEQLRQIEYATSKSEIISLFNIEWNGYSDMEKSRFMFSYINKIIVCNEKIPGNDEGIYKISEIEFNEN